jgi:hypothetical protein
MNICGMLFSRWTILLLVNWLFCSSYLNVDRMKLTYPTELTGTRYMVICFGIDCVIWYICGMTCWLFSTWKHCRQERRLNTNERQFVRYFGSNIVIDNGSPRYLKLTKQLMTHPKNSDEEYLAKFFQELSNE